GGAARPRPREAAPKRKRDPRTRRGAGPRRQQEDRGAAGPDGSARRAHGRAPGGGAMMRAVLLVVALVSVAAAAPPQPLRGSRSLALDRMELVGRAPADLPLEGITVVLGLRDRPGLDAVIAAQGDRRSPRYHRWL